MVHSPIIRPAISSRKRGIGGFPLDFHDIVWRFFVEDSILLGLFLRALELFGESTNPRGPRTPPEIAGLMMRAYENPLVSLNKPLIRPYFWGYVRGVG